MDGEGDVLDHEEDVRHRNGGENEVDGVGPHVLVSEYHDVQAVEESSKNADDNGEIAVERLVSTLYVKIEALQVKTICIMQLTWNPSKLQRG